jgi:hypothetical protein
MASGGTDGTSCVGGAGKSGCEFHVATEFRFGEIGASVSSLPYSAEVGTSWGEFSFAWAHPCAEGSGGGGGAVFESWLCRVSE